MNFISVFLICLICSYVFLFFFGGIIFENLFAMLALFAFIAATLITALISLSDRVDKLEKRITELENQPKYHSTEKSSE